MTSDRNPVGKKSSENVKKKGNYTLINLCHSPLALFTF